MDRRSGRGTQRVPGWNYDDKVDALTQGLSDYRLRSLVGITELAGPRVRPDSLLERRFEPAVPFLAFAMFVDRRRFRTFGPVPLFSVDHESRASPSGGAVSTSPAGAQALG